MKPLLASLLLAVSVAAAACSSDAPDTVSTAFTGAAFATTNGADGSRVEVRFTPNATPSRGSNAAELTIVDGQGVPRDGLHLEVVPWMPAMGHGSSVTPTVTAKGSGKYVAEGVEFFMPGRWELRVAMGQPAGDVVFSIDVP